MIGVGLIVYLSYTLMFWGNTLMNGGPDNTGSWPFLYVLLGLGPKPLTASQTSGGSQLYPGTQTSPQNPYPQPGGPGAHSIAGQIPIPGYFLASQQSSPFTPSA